MSQPIDRVYVEIVPDIKGFDKNLARKIKKQTEDMFKGVAASAQGKSSGGASSGGSGGAAAQIKAGGGGGFFPLGGAMSDPRQFRLQQKMAALAKKTAQEQQRAIDEIHRRAIAEDKRRLAEDEQFRRAVEENNKRDEALQRDHIRALAEEAKRQQQAEDEIHRRAIAEDRRRQQEINNLHVAALQEDRKRQQELDIAHASAIREERRRIQEMNNLHREALRENTERDREQRVRDSRGGLVRQFTRGAMNNVPRSRRSTATEMTGEIATAPFRVSRAALNSMSNFQEDISGTFQLVRGVTIGLAALMTGRLLTAFAGSLPLIAGMAAATFGTITLGMEGTSRAGERVKAEVEGLKPTFEEIRNEANRGLFQGFEGEVTRVADNLKGPVKEGVFEVGQSLQYLAKGVTEYLSSARGAEVVNHIFDTTSRLLRQWRPAIDAAMEGFGDLAIKSTPFVERLNQRLSEGVTKFFGKISEMADDGSLEKFFKDALDDAEAFIQLLGDAKNIAKDIGQLLPLDLLQQLAERSRKSEAREDITGEKDLWDRLDKVQDEALRRVSLEGTKKAPSDLGPIERFSLGKDATAEESVRNMVQRIVADSNNLKTVMGQNFEDTKQRFLADYSAMQNAGLATDQLWTGLSTVSQERAARLFLEFSETNKMAANDFRDSWLEKNNINREEWDRYLAANQEKLTQEQIAATEADRVRQEQERASAAQSTATKAQTSAQSQSIWSGMWSGLQEIGRRGWATITQTNSAALPGFLNGFNTARSQGSGIMSSLWSGLVGAAQAAWNQIKAIWSTSPVTKATWVEPGAPSRTGSWASPSIKGYAHGGIFTGPTAALIGEAGDELAFPLTGSQGQTAIQLLADSLMRTLGGQTNSAGDSGVRVWDGSTAQGGGVTTIVIESDGTDLADFLIELLQKRIRVLGGNVQVVLGKKNLKTAGATA